MRRSVSREAYLVDDEPRIVFLRDTNGLHHRRVLRYCSMRIFVLSTRPFWHGVCVPASIMALGRTMFGVLIAVGVILVCPHLIPAQQSTAPPSSLSTRPLAPGSTESELRPSCDLCRKPDARAGSDIKPHRLHREKGLRPHKTRREPIAHWTKASSRRCLVIHSRPQKIRDSRIRKQRTDKDSRNH